ncbi:hypothetical protein MRS44_003338 [Fusarium solani]|uniref:uncharacterized protein n=1 Tax=Fusarium solani TaxID=169388 RepID=UPI0032C46A5F|nr:hypothetical protein MRS44_003338 [Fusarium solani]
MASNGNFTHQNLYKEYADQHQTAPPAAAAPAAAAATTDASVSAPAGNSNLSKDEVGWYFVEQYYTTLSKSPEKLHLFYGKRSQFVYGLEAEVANVSVGRQAIQERIKALDFQDCKVRVSNVDSQASFENIVIQVIGETSNKAGEPKKFVQTFVLAQQPSGYFVLNDILRYIDDETDDESAAAPEEPVEEPEVAEEEPAAAPVEPEAPKSVEETKEETAQLDPEVVDQKLEEVSTSKDSAALNGSAAESTVEEAKAPEAPEAKPEIPAADADAAAEEIAEEDVKEPEKPKDPSPTPVSKPVAAPPAPVQPAAPPKPMTWASRAAAALPRPVVPLPKTPTPPVPAQSRAPAPAAAAPTSQPAAAPAAPAAAAAPAPAAEPAAKDAAGWQTAGADSKRQNRPQSISGPPTEKEGTLGYVKYVTDKVQDAELRGTLAAFGELTYFDINRQKNCAFVEYKTAEGYQAAVAANPHTVNGENIVVEPRRPKANAYGGSSYGGRGGISGRGRGGVDGGRSGGQGSRGNFSGQNRGRGAPRGRGSSQAQNA